MHVAPSVRFDAASVGGRLNSSNVVGVWQMGSDAQRTCAPGVGRCAGCVGTTKAVAGRE